uniref:Yippee domain-containing protein n=1 Tax=Laticauda laticaudata TaxID=8630 RepID=A0A8C5RP92_LATLA
LPSFLPSSAPSLPPSQTFQAYLPSCHRTYSCIHCRAHLANHDELISKVGHLQAGRTARVPGKLNNPEKI